MKARGFTLVELMVSLAVMSILAAITLPVMERVMQRERERDLRQALGQIRAALDAYKRAADEGRLAHTPPPSGYPARLEVLAEGVREAKGGGVIYFLRRIPRDPFYPDAHTPAAQTWGLRAYASSAQAPRPGADVYDVYSRAPGIGLNGVAYRQW